MRARTERHPTSAGKAGVLTCTDSTTRHGKSLPITDPIPLELLENRVRSDRARVRLTKFSQYLEPHSTVPAVRDFHDRLRALPSAD
ncbi:hypothetical protein [Streptomyces sp. NPDC000410]|uniref:hypothetical protein n=1 Tax=Streptomyces sp. NPDC000410 TaxID=3154254 RepID=UPI0033305C6B